MHRSRELMRPGTADEMQLRRVMLEKIRVPVGASVPEHWIRHGRIDTAIDYLSDNLICQMEIMMAGQTSTEKRKSTVAVTQVPLTWLDHWKASCAPKWFLKRWPAKMRSIDITLQETITTTRICPHVAVENDDRTHFEWVSFGPSEARR